MFRVQIGNEPRLNRSPSQPFLCLRAGSRAVNAEEAGDPGKMISCCLVRFAGETGIGRVLFCCERTLALSEQGPGSDDQGAIRARDRVAKSLDGTLIRLGGRPIV